MTKEKDRLLAQVQATARIVARPPSTRPLSDELEAELAAQERRDRDAR